MSNSKSIKVADSLNVAIGSPTLLHVVKLVVPVSYKLGEDFHEKDLEIIISKDNLENIKDLLKSKHIELCDEVYNLSIEEVIEYPQIVVQIEKFVHDLIKSHYAEDKRA